MKIIFIIDTLRPGGKERRLVELLKWLNGRNEIEYELIVMSNNIHYKEVFDLGVKIHFVIRRIKKDIIVLLKLFRICKTFRPDIIHCWDSMTAIYCVPISILLKKKLVNGMVIDSPSISSILNKDYRRAKLSFLFSDMIVGNSKSGLNAYKAPRNRSIVINNGFNFERIRNIPNQQYIGKELDIDGGNIIGMVASFSRLKDYQTFFNAAQLILKKRNDVVFIAIGSGTDSFESIKLIHKDFLKYFRLLGEKSGIEAYINAMDICVLSTFTEGFSNSILEYMALAKPVIATRGGGTEELVLDKITGFLVEPADPKELAYKIELLLEDPSLRRKMGVAGRKRIRDSFSIDEMSSKYIRLYETLIPD
jgi:glycosyltransferase involved in cell wall biosynthesis